MSGPLRTTPLRASLRSASTRRYAYTQPCTSYTVSRQASNSVCGQQFSSNGPKSSSTLHTSSTNRQTFQQHRLRSIQWSRPASSSATEANLRRTPLYDVHLKHGAKMVPFGGYEMPVQYNDQTVSESHLFTREKASLFDVSHMVQHFMKGPGAQGLLERVTPSGLAHIPNHHSTLSCLLLPRTGGIVDDCVITRIGPEAFYFVTNAACREGDLAFLRENINAWKDEGKPGIEWDVLEGQGLVAVQGPLASTVLTDLLVNPVEDNLDQIYFGQSKHSTLKLPGGRESSPVLVSRGGYTGEDGFEISIPPEETPDVVDYMLATAGPEKLRLAGLGARDSLRLEAGMCLYGHDLDDQTTPVEAGLSWVIPKERRTEGGFNGSDVILKQLKPKKEGGSGTERRRVGFIVEGAPAREGADIVDSDGNSVGKITSGCPSPSLKKNIAMGYVKTGLNKSGTELAAVVRGKQRKAVVTKMPFVPSKYYKG